MHALLLSSGYGFNNGGFRGRGRGTNNFGGRGGRGMRARGWVSNSAFGQLLTCINDEKLAKEGKSKACKMFVVSLN